MHPSYLTPDAIRQFIDRAWQEDIGDGDHSTLAAVPATAQNRARLLIKDSGIVAGVALAELIFRQADSSLRVEILKKDGDAVQRGEVGFTVEGNARAILHAERLVLNCLQRMSGIATYTHRVVKTVEGTRARILDTRKTTPNFRLMEKWAVAIGGGTNHRFGLFDAIILKDNHVDYAGGIRPAIAATQAYLQQHQKDLLVVIETRSLAEVEDVLAVGGVHRIMLDNMLPSTMREAVRLINGRYPTEASGGITLENIREVAESGVDFISVGALTHSARVLDMSLKAF